MDARTARIPRSIPGGPSETIISDAMPVFYYARPAAVRNGRPFAFSSLHQQRGLQLVAGRGLGASKRLADELDMQLTRAAGNIFRLQVKVQLDSGEYALRADVRTSRV